MATKTFATLHTSQGDIKVELFPNHAPKTVRNFTGLATGEIEWTHPGTGRTSTDPLYQNVIFHRIIPNFMIQGGDPFSKDDTPNTRIGNGGPGYTLPAEFNPQFFHKKGALAAARMSDAVNPKKESSGSQFYIVEGQVYDNASINLMAQRMGAEFSSAQKIAYTTIGGTPQLDANYTVFGELVEGLDVISKISNVSRDKNNLPKDKVIMNISFVK